MSTDSARFSSTLDTVGEKTGESRQPTGTFISMFLINYFYDFSKFLSHFFIFRDYNFLVFSSIFLDQEDQDQEEK